jgi:sporulation protein YlmC with PRC-barrel domain
MLWKLSQLRKYQLDEDEPDVRGWPVFDEDGREIGAVDCMIVDTKRDRISHFGVLVKDHVRMVPLEQIEINRNAKEILISDASLAEIDRYPDFKSNLDLLERERQYYVTFEPQQPTEFQPVSIKELLSPEWNRVENDGRGVSIEGSFGQTREDYWSADGTRYCGYKIWDHEGNGLMCANVYTVLDPESGEKDDSNDFEPDFVRTVVYRYGKFVRIDGRYLAQFFEGGAPGILVDFIEGTEVARFKK